MKAIEFLQEHGPAIMGIITGLYELAVRIWPTNKNWSLIDKIIKFISLVVPNRSTKTTYLNTEGKLIEESKKHIIKMILVFCLFSFGINAQTNVTGKSFRSYNADSLTVRTEVSGLQLMYGDVGALYYNKQSSKWRIFSDSTWSDLSGGGGGSVTNAVTADKSNIFIAAAILRPDGNSSAGGNINWTILDPVSGHQSLFFTSVTPQASGALRLNHPTVFKVVDFLVVPDETLASKGIFCGATSGLSYADINVYINAGTYAGYYRGTGTGTFFTAVGDCSVFTNQFVDAGRINFTAPLLGGNLNQNANFQQGCVVSYAGDSNYRIRKIISGLGSNAFGFEIIDNATNSKITTNTTSDIIEVIVPTPKTSLINCNVNNSQGYPGANILTTNSNLWVFAIYQSN